MHRDPEPPTTSSRPVPPIPLDKDIERQAEALGAARRHKDAEAQEAETVRIEAQSAPREIPTEGKSHPASNSQQTTARAVPPQITSHV